MDTEDAKPPGMDGYMHRPPLTYRQAAEALNVSERTIRRLVKSRALPVVHIGGTRRVPAAAIGRYLREHTLDSVAPDRSHNGRRAAPPAQRLEKTRRLWDYNDPLPEETRRD